MGLQESCRDCRRAKRGQRARAENAAQTGMIGKKPKSRRTEAKRDIEKRAVSTHGEPAVLRRRSPDGFDAKAGIDQRVTEASETGASECETE